MPPMRIPLFPLHAVLFPGSALPLRVFEPRYRAMMADVLGTEEEPTPEPAFGIACIREGLEVGARAETHPIGCMGEVRWVRRHPDGTMELIAHGTTRFRIDDRPPDDPYPRADATMLDEPIGPEPAKALDLARAALVRYRAMLARLAGQPLPDLDLGDDPVAASYEASAALRLEPPIHQSLLEARTASERLAMVASIARSEASLLETVGPPLVRPPVRGGSQN
jgi:uncharacterized protein